MKLRDANAWQRVVELLASILDDGDKQPMGRLLWRLQILKEQAALRAASPRPDQEPRR